MSDAASLSSILGREAPRAPEGLITLLQEVQGRHSHLSRAHLEAIAEHLDLPAARVWGVATFYNQFRFTAPGRFHVQVCRGTACHVKASAAVLEACERHLGIADGQTTRDGLFSLETVACIGACGLAPVVRINDDFHAGVTPDSITEVLDGCRAAVSEVQDG
jgi:NADH-quinone oxidoreductase subunit E